MVKLLEGEVLCPTCKGTGLMENDEYRYYPITGLRKQLIACSSCFATGKMDWIEAITGLKKDIPDGYSKWGWKNREDMWR